MEFPDDILGVIREFSRPLCRVDWRQGSYIRRMYVSPASNFHSDVLMRVHDWRERNLEFDHFLESYFQLGEFYHVWKDTYYVHFYPTLNALEENE